MPKGGVYLLIFRQWFIMSRFMGRKIRLPCSLGAAALSLVLLGSCLSAFRTPSLTAIADSALAACIRDAGYNSLEAITRLQCEDYGIEELGGIEQFTNLTELHLPGNYISNLTPLAPLKNLRVLILDLSPVEDLTPLSSLTRIETLSLEDALLKDISHLSGLTALRELNLSDNVIQDVAPLKSLTSLRSLDLSINHVKKGVAALVTLKKAVLIDLSGNINLPADELLLLVKELGEKKVKIYPRSY